MRILVDSDDTICKFADKIIKWWNEDNYTNLSVENIDSYSIRDILGPKAEYFMKSCMRHPDFFNDLDPIPGALEGMKALHDMGHDVLIVSAVSAKAPISYVGKIEWIRTYLPWFNTRNFISAERKELIYGNVLLDDKPSTVLLFQEIERPVVCFDRPWNRYIKAKKRVRNWLEFVEMVRTGNFV